MADEHACSWRFARRLVFLLVPWSPVGVQAQARKIALQTTIFSMALIALAATLIAPTSAWVESNIFSFGPGATPTPSFRWAATRTWLRVVGVYPAWLLAIFMLHRFVACRQPMARDVRWSHCCRFGVPYLLLVVTPQVYITLLVAAQSVCGAYQWPEWLRALIWWHILYRAGGVVLVAGGLAVLLAGLWAQRRMLKSGDTHNRACQGSLAREFGGHP